MAKAKKFDPKAYEADMKARKAKIQDVGAPAETVATPDIQPDTKKPEKAAKAAKTAKSKAGKADKKADTKKQPKAKVDHAAEVANIPHSSVSLKTNTAPSVEIATELQHAFDFFNQRLFEGKLEPVVFSNTRLKKSLGHFWPKSWTRRKDLKGKVHEIGLDFARLHGENDKEVLSTLVHEMCHELIEMLGKKERGHGKYWVAAMLMVGLEPIILDAKGNPTGKATGPNSSHKIVSGGKFDEAAKELLKTGFKLSWANEPMPEPEKKPSKKKKAGAKAKHTCPVCQRNAWGAPSLYLHCKGGPEDSHDLTEMDCDREEYAEGADKDEAEE